MNYLGFALLAYFLNSISAVVNKFLLTKHVVNPLGYIFYFCIFALITSPLVFFTPLPTLPVVILGFLATLLWTIGAYFLFKGLQIGQTSRVIPIIGTLVPLLLLAYYSFIAHQITYNQVWAAMFLTLGLIFLTLPYYFDHKSAFMFPHLWLHGQFHHHHFFMPHFDIDRKKSFPFIKELTIEVLAALFLASSYILLREAYLQATFLTVFAWSRLILIPVGAILFLVPKFKKEVISHDRLKINFLSLPGILFLLSQVAGGLSELLLTFAISLASPALVLSLQGTQYVYLLVFSIILQTRFPNIFKESLTRLSLFGKIIGIILIATGLYILAFVNQSDQKPKVNYGVTYSPQYAEDLGLDPKDTYIKMLDDLKVKQVRLPVYWDQVEKDQGIYDFSEIDFYINEAQKREVKVLLGLGYKQVRWPECYLPSWAKNMSKKVRDQALLDLIKAEVTHFRKFNSIAMWQVENEPFLHFGVCEKRQKDEIAHLLEKEVAQVKALDSRPILITDSGELSLWENAMKQGDYFGFTLYRRVWNPYIGMVDYPLPPAFYQLKDTATRLLYQKNSIEFKDRSLIAELQAEPWTNGVHIVDMPINDQITAYSIGHFQSTLDFATETNFTTAYLWGVEWWYWIKEKGHPEYLSRARQLF